MNIHPITPIKTEADYQQALHEIESLFEAQPNTPEGDRLDVLTTLVEAYEDKQGYTLPFPDPIEAIRYYLESRGLSDEDLAQYLGDRQLAHMILQRTTPLSIEMIRELHNGIGISADILIQPYPLRQRVA
jgi:HTH-type transcriptional regulator / antitoxin HigA